MVLESNPEWALAAFAALGIGLAKSGFTGASLISIAIFIDLFGAREQTGLALPLMIFADLLVFPLFRKHGSWKELWKLLPASLVGIAGGWWMLGRIDNDAARTLIGSLIVILLGVQMIRAFRPGLLKRMADRPIFGLGAGLGTGVATMLANAAGPIFQLYLMSRKVPKMEMMGIGARFFLLVNLLKVPLNQDLSLITRQSLILDLCLAPAVVVGVLGGKYLLQWISQKWFEWLIVVFALFAAVRMIVA